MAGFGVPFLAVLTVLVCMFGLAPAPAANRRPVPAPSWKLSASVTQKVMVSIRVVHPPINSIRNVAFVRPNVEKSMGSARVNPRKLRNEGSH